MSFTHHLFVLIHGADSAGQGLDVDSLLLLDGMDLLEADDLLQVLLDLFVDILQTTKYGFTVTTELEEIVIKYNI